MGEGGRGGKEREEGRGRKGDLNVIIMCIGLDRYKTLIINWGVHFFCRPTHLVKLIDETHTLWPAPVPLPPGSTPS